MVSAGGQIQMFPQPEQQFSARFRQTQLLIAFTGGIKSKKVPDEDLFEIFTVLYADTTIPDEIIRRMLASITKSRVGLIKMIRRSFGPLH